MTPAGTAAVALSYLVGSVPTAYLAVRWVKRVDVRTIGSGNVGATNASRILGFKGGAAVFLLDMLKGFAAARVIAPWLVPWAGGPGELACGLAAILGHNFPVFLKFRGGKGVSTTVGVLAGTMPVIALICAAAGFAVFWRWRFVSLASMASAAVLPVVMAAAQRAPREVALGILLSVLIIVQHRQNIRRLLDGTELPAGRKKSS